MKRILFILFTFYFSKPMFACTAFCINSGHQIYAAKSYDWHIGEGYLIKNNRGLNKSGFPFSQKHKMQWVSDFGSVTFNQYGKEFPVGGINEAGLVVEALWLSETEYPQTATKGFISELEWVQYQLDNFANVDQVICKLEEVVIKPIAGELHFFIADERGQSAVIEFLNQKTVVSRMDGKHQAITNNNYNTSQNYYQKSSKSKSMSSCRKSLCRYQTACVASTKFAQQNPTTAQLFSTLSDVRIRGYTRWNIVYDICNRKIMFRSDKAQDIKQIDVARFDYSPESDVVFYDINDTDAGNITNKFKLLSSRANLTLLEFTLNEVGVQIDYSLVNNHQMKQQIAKSYVKNNF